VCSRNLVNEKALAIWGAVAPKEEEKCSIIIEK
jgi:hypothetical protein